MVHAIRGVAWILFGVWGKKWTSIPRPFEFWYVVWCFWIHMIPFKHVVYNPIQLVQPPMQFQMISVRNKKPTFQLSMHHNLFAPGCHSWRRGWVWWGRGRVWRMILKNGAKERPRQKTCHLCMRDDRKTCISVVGQSDSFLNALGSCLVCLHEISCRIEQKRSLALLEHCQKHSFSSHHSHRSGREKLTAGPVIFPWDSLEGWEKN